ncbi:hypothetical protein MLD38_026242 [Melastoma candidum]|uniref:Uncharacterized protein n=1 Tax=Melastoma candidum TaxID=119954 RepID=A0ACB9P1G5_9MYRT|nr:hypothetical protein MLD38_026242 [Melastoma candidum]
MGISLSRNVINVFLSLYNTKKVAVPGKLFHVQIEDVVSRTGRHLQRYNKGRRQVVGCIPYRYRGIEGGSAGDAEIEVLLVSSQKGGKGMMFPKGGWEIDETMEQAALRETREEAGVVGTLEDKLGKWMYKSKSNGSDHDGYMFSLHVHEQLESWPEKDLRKRRWVTAAEAKEACPHGWMKEALDELVYRLKKQQNGERDVFSS